MKLIATIALAAAILSTSAKAECDASIDRVMVNLRVFDAAAKRFDACDMRNAARAVLTATDFVMAYCRGDPGWIKVNEDTRKVFASELRKLQSACRR